jgi:hypothetical protein
LVIIERANLPVENAVFDLKSIVGANGIGHEPDPETVPGRTQLSSLGQ